MTDRLRYEAMCKEYAAAWNFLLDSNPARQISIKLLRIVSEESPENLPEGPRR